MAFHMPWECSDSNLHYPIGELYIEPLGYIEEENLERKETINHYCLTCLCLSLHPFVPLERTFLLFPSLSFPCKFVIVMEEWSGGGLGFSALTRCRQSFSLFYLCLLLIEMSISCPLHVYKYEYFVHGCIYLLIHDGLYMLE